MPHNKPRLPLIKTTKNKENNKKYNFVFQTDFVLVIIREMLHVYPALRVILMSATIDTTMFSEYFGDCPVLEAEGRTFPVQGERPMYTAEDHWL